MYIINNASPLGGAKQEWKGLKKMNKKIKSNLFYILLVYLAVGFIYPAIGMIALICMVAPVIIAPSKGRYWCGNYCPRGNFYDNVVSRMSNQKSIPRVFRSKGMRLFSVVFIMTVFSFQMYYAWGNLSEMGAVFLRIIFATTVVGVVLGLLYHRRTWCSFCPMGTLANWVSKESMPLKVDNTCVSCKLCSKVCPLQLEPYKAKGTYFTESDCLKCNRCVNQCPKKALSF